MLDETFSMRQASHHFFQDKFQQSSAENDNIAALCVATSLSLPLTKASLIEPHRNAEWLLLEEMNHRVNNELSSAISIVSLIAARSDNGELKAALGSAIDLLYNHARVHRALQMLIADKWTDAACHMRTLCHSMSRAKLERQGIQLILVEHPLQLPSEQCWRLGLVVYELITNAARYAFGGRGGAIRIEIMKHGSVVECRVTDNGEGCNFIRPGRGSRIVRLLAESLGGRIEQEFGSQGTTSVLSFRLPEMH